MGRRDHFGLGVELFRQLVHAQRPAVEEEQEPASALTAPALTITLVPADLSLFGDDEPDQRDDSSSPAPAPIATWQVDLLRKALDARGLTTMTERQEAIETAIGRSVESLRAMTHDEGLRGISKLAESAAPRSGAASVWDERDEDTWIDRL